jgi:hypothetical protein
LNATCSPSQHQAPAEASPPGLPNFPVNDQELPARPLATAMMSLSTPCPASSGPAPGPMIVTCPTGLASNTTAFAVPSTPASRSS